MTTYDFEGIANGQPWPAPWVTGGFGDTTRDVQSEKGRLRATRQDFGVESRGWAWQAVAHANVDWAVAISMTDTLPDDTYSVLMGARSATPIQFAWDWPASGYYLEMRYDGTGLVRLVKRVDSVTTVLATYDPGDFQDGLDWIFRLKVLTVGATVEVRAKMWHEAADEPGWLLSFDDSAGDRITAAGACTLGAWAQSAGGSGQYLELRTREAEVVNPADFDYTAPVLTATLDDTDYTVDLAWTGDPSNVEIQRETWAGQGEPWL